MEMKLIYNPASGVWMPPPELRPREQQFAQPQPLLSSTPRFAPLPPMPARPLRPNIQMATPRPVVHGPQYGRIPNMPRMPRARLPQMPIEIRKRGKWGQYSITDTVPNPDILPAPNLPKLANYNAQNMRSEQARINEKIKNYGGGKPMGLPVRFRAQRGLRLKAADLGLNATKGSNSKYLGFGSNLGRTVERAWGLP